MGCRFCASTQGGRVRNLTAGEIANEVYALSLIHISAAALLHGVTSSSKTLVFLKLIEKAVAAGRKALVLSLIHISHGPRAPKGAVAARKKRGGNRG